MAMAKHIRTSIAQEGMSCHHAVVSPDDAATLIARLYRLLIQLQGKLNEGAFTDGEFESMHELSWKLADIICDMPLARPMDQLLKLMAKSNGGDLQYLEEDDSVLLGCRRLADDAVGLLAPDQPSAGTPLRALHGEWAELIAKDQGDSFDRIAVIEDEAAVIVPATVEEFALKILIADGGGDMNANTSLMALRDLASQIIMGADPVPLRPSALRVAGAPPPA